MGGVVDDAAGGLHVEWTPLTWKAISYLEVATRRRSPLADGVMMASNRREICCPPAEERKSLAESKQRSTNTIRLIGQIECSATVLHHDD